MNLESTTTPSPNLEFPWLDALHLGRLRLRFKVGRPVVPGPFPENRVRGSLGKYLRELEICATIPTLDCNRCFMTDRCNWFALFGEPARGHSRPYRLELGDVPDVGALTPGQEAVVYLTLFGPAMLQAERLAAAFHHPRAAGALFGGEARLAGMERLSTDGQFLPYRIGENIGVSLSALVDRERLETLEQASHWQLALRTPLTARLHEQGMARGFTLAFTDLVQLSVRRTLGLAQDFGGVGHGMDFRPFAEAAAKVEVTSADLQWSERIRHSFRQEQNMAMGGLVGTVTYGGPVSPFARLLLAVEQVGLGKRTTFGFGQLRVEAAEGGTTSIKRKE